MKTLIALLSVTILAVGCTQEPTASEPSQAADTVPATISNFAFEPEVLELEEGQTVTWTNEDDIAHTVTSGRAKKQGVPGVSEDRDAAPDGTFDSGTMELDDTFEFTFDESGTYTYFCAIHAGMSARIVVS